MLGRFQRVTLPWARSFASQTIPSGPASIVLTTWPAGIKHKGSDGHTSYIKPLSGVEAKEKRAGAKTREERQRVEVFGHAALEFTVDLSHAALDRNGINKELMDLNLKSNLQTLKAIVSWYPMSLLETGESFTATEKNKFLSHLPSLTTGSPAHKVRQDVMEFLMKEYQAENGNIEADIRGYGKPDPDRVIKIANVDAISVIREIKNMMQYHVDKSTIIFDEVLEGASYYAIDMLRELGDITDSLGISRVHTTPQHVCTTATLRILKAAVGENTYTQEMKRILENSVELETKLPFVEIVHKIGQRLASLELKNVHLKEDSSVDTPTNG